VIIHYESKNMPLYIRALFCLTSIDFLNPFTVGFSKKFATKRVHSLRVSISHFSLLKCDIPTFNSSGLWTQHPDLNPANYNICSEMQQPVYLREDYGLALAGLALTYASSVTQQMSNANVSECAFT